MYTLAFHAVPGLLFGLNCGIRRASMPLGDGSCPRENEGNKQVTWMLRVIEEVKRRGGFYTIENPQGSMIWNHPGVRRLITNGDLSTTFHQCMYGLMSPAGVEPREIWYKPTTLLHNKPTFAAIESRCNASHTHTRVLGSCCLKGQAVHRSKLAGRYPVQIVSKYAACASLLF